MVRYCAVYGCSENDRNKHIMERRFFGFPVDEERSKHWVKIIGRKDLETKSAKTLRKHYFVCELHFCESEIMKKNLKKTAVPTLLLPQLENSSNTTKYTQTEVPPTCHNCNSESKLSDIILSTSSSEEASHRRMLQTLEIKKRKLLEQPTENCTEETKLLTSLIKIAETVTELKRKSEGKKYDDDYVDFALNLYYASPVAYRFLSGVLPLPDIKILQKRIAFHISTKFDENIIKCLKAKVSYFSPSKKCCIVSIGRIPLKKHLHYVINKDKIDGFHEIDNKRTKEIANQVYVVTARGIFSNWEQPLACCFRSENDNYEDLHIWLENIIEKMIEIGYDVRALTCEQSSNFIELAKNKFVSKEQPFVFINGRKIYYIFDIPYLLKSLRNNLISHDFIYEDTDESIQIASWDDIIQVYETEKEKNYKIAFKLTESHIRPNDVDKESVKYAAQVLSRSVAAAIYSLIETGILPGKSMGTMKFIELFNDTFDILNSSKISNDYKFKNAFRHADYQTNILHRARHVLQQIRIIKDQEYEDAANIFQFVEGFLISIHSILNLASDLKDEGYDHVLTRRFSMDALEKFFEKEGPQGVNGRNPTANEFLAAFRQYVMTNIIKDNPYTMRANDLDTLCNFLAEFKPKEKVPVETIKILKVGTYDYRFDLPEQNIFTYVCGYLLVKCEEYHNNCKYIKAYMKKCEHVNRDEGNFFKYFKVYRATEPLVVLISPPDDFRLYIQRVDCICEDHLENADFYHVGTEIIPKIEKLRTFGLPCPCFPLEFLNNLYVRLRIYNVLLYNNRNLKFKSSEPKYFKVPYVQYDGIRLP